mmetsp:Transcript_28020/g.77083  ORF Transcript_28020/g.77083 Transcript_28020/m.77083 type:complete len:118 (+) Transcript_28020:1194-1547(+)
MAMVADMAASMIAPMIGVPATRSVGSFSLALGQCSRGWRRNGRGNWHSRGGGGRPITLEEQQWEKKWRMQPSGGQSKSKTKQHAKEDGWNGSKRIPKRLGKGAEVGLWVGGRARAGS